MAAATLVLLFLAFGSVLLPIKAVLMNLVSIGASFGVVVWVFQDGHLADLLGFTSTGFIEPSNPILMLAVLFGLATDYEVFLLSRVREEWDRTGDNTAVGRRRAAAHRPHHHRGGAAAGVVVAGFATGGVAFIKMIGVGMIVAIVVDATLVRGCCWCRRRCGCSAAGTGGRRGRWPVSTAGSASASPKPSPPRPGRGSLRTPPPATTSAGPGRATAASDGRPRASQAAGHTRASDGRRPSAAPTVPRRRGPRAVRECGRRPRAGRASLCAPVRGSLPTPPPATTSAGPGRATAASDGSHARRTGGRSGRVTPVRRTGGGRLRR